MPLSRAEIKQLKRNRDDEAISSGTHNTLTLTPTPNHQLGHAPNSNPTSTPYP